MQLLTLVDDNEFTCIFSEALWDVLRELAEAQWAVADALTRAHELLEPLLVDARSQTAPAPECANVRIL